MMKAFAGAAARFAGFDRLAEAPVGLMLVYDHFRPWPAEVIIDSLFDTDTCLFTIGRVLDLVPLAAEHRAA